MSRPTATIGDAADPIGETERLHPAVTGIEARMDVHDRAGRIGRGPERIEVGIVEHRSDAARQRADHDAGKPRIDRGLQHGGGARAVLQRHGGERNETWLGFGRGEQRVVDEPAPGFAFGGGKLVAEHVDPAADHLAIDALAVHPGEPSRKVGERLRYRARRLAVRERKGEASAVLDQAQRGKSILRLGDGGQQVRRHQMGMGIDDHPWLPSPAPAASSWPGEPL